MKLNTNLCSLSVQTFDSSVVNFDVGLNHRVSRGMNRVSKVDLKTDLTEVQ